MEAMCRGIRHVETRGTYCRSLREFARFVRTQRGFRFTAEEVRRYKRYLVTRKKYSRATVSTYLTAVRRLGAHLVARGLLTENPAREVPARQPKRVHAGRALSTEEVRRFEDSLSEESNIGRRDRAMAALMLYGGLSGTELVKLNNRDVERRMGGWMIKSGQREVLVTHPHSIQALEAYMDIRRTERLPADQPLFVSAGNRTRGQRMSTRGVRSALHVYFERAALKGRGVSLQMLRFTAARLMFEAGASVEELKNRLGLRTDQTAKIYLHTIEAAQRK